MGVDEGTALAAEIGVPARFVHLEVTDEASWAASVQVAVDGFGSLTVLVNNAGIAEASTSRRSTGSWA